MNCFFRGRVTITESTVNLPILVGLFSLLGGLTIAISSNSVLAQITPDNTLGVERSVITPNVNIKGVAADQINGGAIRGSNLFHSFREFNVKDGQRVYFSNPAGINNILSRVTGNTPSSIFGTLGVNGNANLFFINPNGIIFGKNASLDVGKSFYATTASSIKFGELGEFSATNPQLPSPLLTINPSAFFFSPQAKPGDIIAQSRVTQTVQGTPTDGLQVPNGQTLLLLGGNVTVDNGRLIARGGRVEIGAVARGGSVGLNANGSLNFPDTIQRADVVFNNKASANRSGIDVRFDNGGDIGITAGNISLFSGSQLRAGIASGFGTLASQGGSLIVNATGEVRMTGEDTRMANDIRPNAIGKAGNIQVTAPSLVVTNGAQLSASTFGIGDAGNVTITANRVFLSGARADELGPSAVFTRVEADARGKGGNVKIFTNTLDVRNGAALIASTVGTGDSGDVVIVARDRVFFDGISAGKQFVSGAFSYVSLGANGKGGNIQISTNTIEVTNGAQLGASTAGTGNAGNILINAAKSINIAGSTPLAGYSSGLFTSTSAFSVGKGGDIIINTQAFRLADGAVIDSRTSTNGNSGNITINAAKVDILNGGQILAITEGKGRAGNITVNATQPVTLAGTDSTFANRLAVFRNRVAPLTPNSGIFVRSQAAGGAGEITITAPSLRLEQGILSAESATVDGGNIALNPRDVLLLRNHSLISATAGTSQQNGNGGNITINAPQGFIVASPNENSDITANAFKGSGGKVTINAAGIFELTQRSRQELEQLLQTTDPTKLNPSQLPTNDITAISQTNPSLNGQVNVNTPDTDPSKGLQELPIDIFDVSRIINHNLCVASQGSEFIVTGRGGLPPSPYDILSPDTTWEDWWISPQPQTKLTPTTHNSSHKQQTESTTMVAAQGWVTDANGNVILTTKPVTVTPQGSWLHPQDCQMLRG
jgi:filamentous hemagglutinin family protein